MTDRPRPQKAYVRIADPEAGVEWGGADTLLSVKYLAAAPVEAAGHNGDCVLLRFQVLSFRMEIHLPPEHAMEIASQMLLAAARERQPSIP